MVKRENKHDDNEIDESEMEIPKNSLKYHKFSIYLCLNQKIFSDDSS